MKKIIVFLFTLGLVWGAYAAVDYKVWMSDSEAAFAKAKEENKPILAVFSGSDWCPPCKMLDKEILGQKDFTGEMADRAILLFVDFPKKLAQTEKLKKQNEKLAKEYKIEAFPTVVVMSADKKILYQEAGIPQIGKLNVANFIKWFDKIVAKPKTK